MKENDALQVAYDFLKARVPFAPDVAVVLGSGLGAFAESIDIATTVDYREIPGFPVSTVAGHKGRFVFGLCGGVKVAVMQGRIHFYEGYEMWQVVMPVRLLGLLGARAVVLTNAAGGIRQGLSVGDFLLLRDQISCFVPSPLIGPNPQALGPRFPDMSEVYDPALRRVIGQAADRMGIPLQEGVYVQLTGPNYETPAEIRMLAALGADAVGMSTACEAIAARHMGLRVAGVSCICNLAAGISPHPLSHQEVTDITRQRADDFVTLLASSVSALGEVI